ncbi:lysylphosphatidylglycerol synthase domain-containing protein [Phytohabitans flavus]|uniref:lysylphosphatidylglycerol synthase domain-containing protein n=1 Tax=Phytohabitans flavus TaxID=1076124 RepID=UPI0015651FE2|nr:lysylphosphatidylglycerol synthase domain-containing protein [Phytohabitans flavus]
MVVAILARAAPRTLRRAAAVAASPWARGAVLVVTVAAAVWTLSRLPAASPLPLLLAALPWIAGKYLLCPLRWHALAGSGRSRWWHIRTYAESELLGQLSPGHAGADVWRVHRLHRAGIGKAPAVAGVALDRLVGAAGVALAVLATGTALPGPVLGVAGVVAAAVLAAAVTLRARRPQALAGVRLRPGPIAAGLLLSVGYQASIAGLVFGAVAAVGGPVDPVRLLAVFGASQVAGILPGFAGASPRHGALAVGLTTLGLTWTVALAAAALVALLPWAPALLLGGGSLAASRLSATRAATARGDRRPGGARPGRLGG